MQKSATKTKYIGGGKKIVGITLSILVLLFAVAALCAKIAAGKGPVYFFGYMSFVVATASMEPEYPTYSLVIVKNEPFPELKVGDVIVFASNALSGRLAFHRIIRIESGTVYTKGDNCGKEDNQPITEQTYVGKGVAKIGFVGRYIKLLHTPNGAFVYLVLPLGAALMIFIAVKLLRGRGEP